MSHVLHAEVNETYSGHAWLIVPGVKITNEVSGKMCEERFVGLNRAEEKVFPQAGVDDENAERLTGLHILHVGHDSCALAGATD